MWRAPLAGLASLAMVATMGVAASTANAAQAAPDTTVKAGDNAATSHYVGETIADALGYDAGGNDYTSKLAVTPKANEYFGGWYLDGQLADLNTPLPASGSVLQAKWYTTAQYAQNKSDLVKVTYTANVARVSLLAGGEANADGSYTVYVPKGALADQFIPADKAGDGKLVSTYSVTTVAKDGSGSTDTVDVDAADLAGVTEGIPSATAAEVTIDVKSECIAPAVTVKFDRTSANTAKGYAVGSQSDGDNDSNVYSVDVVPDEKDNVTVPQWFAYPVTAGDTKTNVNRWGVSSTNTSYTAGEQFTASNGFTLTPVAATAGYTVKFVVDGKQYGVTQFINKGSKTPFVTVPDSPTKADYAFAGWRSSADGKLYVDESNSKGPHLSDLEIAQDTVFTAEWNKLNAEVKVTFKDASYSGANKSESVMVKVPGTLTEDQAPQWKRDGYNLTWFKDANHNGKLDGTEEAYDWSTWITDATPNFTLTASWTQATSDTAKAALNYVLPDTYAKLYKSGTGTAPDHSDDGSAFTDASWTAYEKAYKPILEKYLTEVFNQPNTGVQGTAAAEIIDELNDALAGLKFKSSSKVAAPVYRLRTGTWDNGRHHLWTTDRNEVNTLTKTTHTNGAAGWVLEDTAFTALNTKASADRANSVPGSTKDYKNAEYYVSTPEDSGALKPIARNVYRLNSDITKEHLYTTDYNEYEVQGNNGWQQEDVAFIVPTYNGTDVYRFYTPSTLQHVWTRDLNEYNTLTQQHPDTYQAEGVAFKAL